MKFAEYNNSLIRPRGNYFAFLVLGLALCCPLTIYFLNPVATAYVSDGFLQLSPLWFALAGLGGVLALTGLVYMVRMIADIPVEEKKEVTEAGVALEAARVALEAARVALEEARAVLTEEKEFLTVSDETRKAVKSSKENFVTAKTCLIGLEKKFKLNARKLGLYILKHIVLYTLVGGGLAGVIGWLAAGGNLAGVFGVVGPDAVYVNIAFVIGLSLLAWKFLAWGSDHTSRIFTMKSLQWRDPKYGKEGKEHYNEQFLLNNDGLLAAWGEHKLFRKAAWKDNFVMMLWAGYLATIPYLAHTIHWFNSDFATGVALVFFAVVLQTAILALKRDFSIHDHKSYDGLKIIKSSELLSRYVFHLFCYCFLPFCLFAGILFALGATGVITVNDPALAMVILPSILLGLFLVKFLVSTLILSNGYNKLAFYYDKKPGWEGCLWRKFIPIFLASIIGPIIFVVVWIFAFMFSPLALVRAHERFEADCALAASFSDRVVRPRTLAPLVAQGDDFGSADSPPPNLR